MRAGAHFIRCMKILLVEDDPETATLIRDRLQEQGHAVEIAVEGRSGLARASADRYEVMIIDRMLPGIDGLSIVERIRAAGVRCPVLMLTTLSGIEHRVEGLEAGADDYLVKPFAFAELLARMNALLRRPPLAAAATRLQVGDLELDRLQRTVTRAGTPIELQPQEYKLLEFLMRHSNQVVTRTMLLESVWGFHFDPRTTVVETHISRLRAKIDRNFGVELLHTVRGAGYCLSATG
jgi:two-component system, OmpR family, response regulator